MSEPRWIAFWGALLLCLTVLMLPFHDIDPIAPALLGGAGLGTLALAGLIWITGRRRAR